VHFVFGLPVGRVNSVFSHVEFTGRDQDHIRICHLRISGDAQEKRKN
jgi:hypothetical protein